MEFPHTFMVVDDDAMNNLICKFTILRFNPEATIALYTDPEIALEAISETYNQATSHTPTILFLDLNMPAMTGWEFLDAFSLLSKSIQEQFIIYILSSSIDEVDKEKGESTPLVSGFFSKPLSFETLEHLFGTIGTNTCQ